MHPVMPSPRKEATKPKACTPQPIKPRMMKAITNKPMNPSIAIMSFMLLYRYFLVTVPLCDIIISTHGGTHDDVAPLGDDVENLGAIASTAETPTIATHRGSLKLGRLVWINAVNKITFFYSCCHNIVYLKSKF